MGIFNAFKRALGFSGNDDDFEEYEDSSTAVYSVVTPEKPEEVPPSPSTPPHFTPTADHKAWEEVTLPAEVSLPENIFDAIIERFNQFQPEFVRQCLSIESERKILIEDISAKLKDAAASEQKPEADTKDSDTSERIADLESQLAAREHTIREDKRYTDSLERQKASLLERIDALERSMRVCHTPRTSEPAVDQNPVPADHAADPDEISRLSSELEREKSLREQLELKSRMADTMLTDLRNSAAAARQELEEVRTAGEKQLIQLQQEHEKALAAIEIEQKTAVEEISSQISAFEDVKARLEQRIADLQSDLKEEREKSRRYSEEIEVLRSTIENNLYNQANTELRLRSEIKRLQSQLSPASVGDLLNAGAKDWNQPQPAPDHIPEGTSAEVTGEKTEDQTVSAELFDPEPAPAPEPEPAPRRKRGRPRKQPYDAELDNPSGFSSTSRRDDPEFGYHEPPHRPANDSAAQLSLF
ncbi:MAG: hypothetical protein K2K55_00610 [Duncaniella sp.]|nr:hypothetical protein [Duncaniella sp.]